MYFDPSVMGLLLIAIYFNWLCQGLLVTHQQAKCVCFI